MVIALMGVTGSGKSSFISLLADQDVEISHSLHSSNAPACKSDPELTYRQTP